MLGLGLLQPGGALDVALRSLFVQFFLGLQGEGLRSVSAGSGSGSGSELTTDLILQSPDVVHRHPMIFVNPAEDLRQEDDEQDQDP